MNAKNHPGSLKTPETPAALNETEVRLLDTLRSMGAMNAAAGQPSEKLERKAQVRHGPMMHSLRELEREGLVGRVVGRKDVMFHVR